MIYTENSIGIYKKFNSLKEYKAYLAIDPFLKVINKKTYQVRIDNINKNLYNKKKDSE
jgi:hypothetical protein